MTPQCGTIQPIGHYTAQEAARLVGVSPRRISRWSSYGIVPSISQRPSVYSYADVGEAILVHYLINLEHQPHQVKDLVERLRQQWGQWPLSAAPLEHDGKLVVIKYGDNLVIDAIDRVEHTVLHETLNLEEIRKALRRGGWVSLPITHEHIEARKHIEVDPAIHSGQPVVSGHRIPTTMVAEVADEQAGRDILREEYGLSDEEIDAAIEYEEAIATVLAA